MQVSWKSALSLCVAALLIALTVKMLWRSSAMPQRVPPVCTLGKTELGRFVDIPGGAFIMGAHALYPEEGPPTRVFVSPFQLQVHEVTNSQFAEFVSATGYVTDAEKKDGSAQFRETDTPSDLLSWWSIDAEASWKTPGGSGTDLSGLDLYPVVHVSLNDARAYAKWAGGRIPTQVEWEYAASLGLFDASDPESGMRAPDGTARANVWTGPFPIYDSGRDGYVGAAPVGCFQPGLTGGYDMIGNVWEWTDSPFANGTNRYAIKGGSYLCSENFCRRYRVAARDSLEYDFSSAHIGFRIIKESRTGD